MANSFSTIQKYLTKAFDTVMATESTTAVLEGGSKFIDVNFQEAGYVKILDFMMDGLSDYYRANSTTADSGRTNYNASGVHGDGYRIGNVHAKWQIYELKHDRGKQFQVDEMDNEEMAGMVLANLLSEFMRTHVVPEVDATRFSTIASNAYTSLGNKVVETPNATKGDASEITHCWNKAFEWLKEHEVPEKDQVIFISPAIETLIQNTGEIYKTLTQTDYVSERGVTFKFKAYNGRPLIVVPSDRFFDKIAFGDNGFSPAANSKVINYIVCSVKAVLPIVKLQKSKIFGPDVVQNFDGYKVNFRMYHDVIIPKNKVIASYVSMSTVDATTKSSLLSVALTKEAAANTYKLVGAYSQPAGMLGKVIWSKTALTVGTTANSTQLQKVIEEGENFTVTAGDTKEFFGLVDNSNTIIAASAETTLPTE